MAGQEVKLLNNYLDNILSLARGSIESHGEVTVPLPDMDEDFETGRGVFKIKGNLKTSGGKFGDLSTLRRLGDVTVERSQGGLGLSFKAEVGLSKAFVDVERYAVRLGRRLTGLQGHLGLGIRRNSALVRIDLGPDPRSGAYKATLVSAKINSLNDLKVTVTGLGPFNSLTGWIASKLVETMKEDLTLKMNQILETALKEALQGFDVNDIVKSLFLSHVSQTTDPSTMNTVRGVYELIFD